MRMYVECEEELLHKDERWQQNIHATLISELWEVRRDIKERYRNVCESMHMRFKDNRDLRLQNELFDIFAGQFYEVLAKVDAKILTAVPTSSDDLMIKVVLLEEDVEDENFLRETIAPFASSIRALRGQPSIFK